jgi:hypothetical protein
MEDPRRHNSLFKLEGSGGQEWGQSAYWLFTSHESTEPDHQGHVVGFVNGYDTRYQDATQPYSKDAIGAKASRGDVKAYSWTHVVATLKASPTEEAAKNVLAHEIYLNGKQTQRFVDIPALAPSQISNATITVGDCLCTSDTHSTSYEFKGVMRDIRVFTKALSPSEIRALYTTTMPPQLPENYQCGA